MAKPKSNAKPKLTNAERHKRFLEMAREVEADESAKSFDMAFDRVAKRGSLPTKKNPKTS